ncbi:MAG: hypothetical protein RLY78_3780, partial [Pseudomonadota bacterium]
MSDSASVPVPSPVPSVPATAGVDAGRRALGRSGLGVLALIGLVGAGGWAGSRGGTAEPAAGDPLLATVQRGDIEDLVSATGALQPHEHVDVGVQLSGQIQRIVVEVGSEVRAGDLLAEIDAETVTARVDASRAELRAQQAQLDEREVARAKAERDWRRQLALQADDASTVETVQNAETELRTAQAQIAALKAQMEQLQATLRVEEANLKYARILAPIDGTVVSISARPGQTLNASQNAPTLLRIGDLGTMTVQAQVSEADVSRLQPGLPVYFTTLGGQGRRWQTRVRKIEPTPTVTNNVVLYNVLFDVPNPGRSLMSQMTAQVFFVAAAARDVLTVPVSALSLVRTPGRRGADDA